MKECFCIDHFFSVGEMNLLEQLILKNGNEEANIADEGPFAGKLIVAYVPLSGDNNIKSFLYEKLLNTLPKKFIIGQVTRVKLYLPWDIHSDYYTKQVPEGYVPYYNLLIPLDDVESRTIVFDQFTNSDPNFSVYKKTHKPVENPVDEKFWNDNLSMCWPQDREYVTVKEILPWQRRGQLVGFPSKYFHSSDQFHLRFNYPKSFIQIRTGEPI